MKLFAISNRIPMLSPNPTIKDFETMIKIVEEDFARSSKPVTKEMRRLSEMRQAIQEKVAAKKGARHLREASVIWQGERQEAAQETAQELQLLEKFKISLLTEKQSADEAIANGQAFDEKNFPELGANIQRFLGTYDERMESVQRQIRYARAKLPANDGAFDWDVPMTDNPGETIAISGLLQLGGVGNHRFQGNQQSSDDDDEMQRAIRASLADRSMSEAETAQVAAAQQGTEGGSSDQVIVDAPGDQMGDEQCVDPTLLPTPQVENPGAQGGPQTEGLMMGLMDAIHVAASRQNAQGEAQETPDATLLRRDSHQNVARDKVALQEIEPEDNNLQLVVALPNPPESVASDDKTDGLPSPIASDDDLFDGSDAESIGEVNEKS